MDNNQPAHLGTVVQMLDKDPTSDNRCRDTLSDSENSVLRTCSGCGRGFVPTGPQRYCSHECSSGALRVPIESRFWPKVNKTAGCWLWTAYKVGGYGRIALNGRPAYAHRLSWEFAHGPVPDGMEVLHKCDVPACVRPDHLFLGSQADNLADARQKGRLDTSGPRAGAKLTYHQRLTIYMAPARRHIVSELAKEYGVSLSTICMIRKGRFARPKLSLEPVSSNELQIRGEVA